MSDSKPLQANHQAELKILQARVKELESKEQQYRQAEVAEHRFQQQLMDLLDINIQLSKIDSFDDFCRQAVELCRDRLGFDRAGLLFFSEEDPNIVVGTFGTDDKGQTRDEHT
ncbi:MAG: hypothetical protein JSV03_17620 [Planctomycetota bacterium]|nr:MAG: hypothetical protein JSV03_17620 [Planctomycetota bacterium]